MYHLLPPPEEEENEKCNAGLWADTTADGHIYSEVKRAVEDKIYADICYASLIFIHQPPA